MNDSEKIKNAIELIDNHWNIMVDELSNSEKIDKLSVFNILERIRNELSWKDQYQKDFSVIECDWSVADSNSSFIALNLADFCTSWPFYFLWVQRKTKRKKSQKQVVEAQVVNVRMNIRSRLIPIAVITVGGILLLYNSI